MLVFPRRGGVGLSLRVRLQVEQLESRETPSVLGSADEFHPVIVAGDPSIPTFDSSGLPKYDSPSARIDANTTDSPFAGVGSVEVMAVQGAYIYTYIGTGTLISDQHVLTAGHVVDINNDGKSDWRDGIVSITFYLNFGGDQTHTLAVSSVTVHPDYTGFNRPSINDDLAILTLAAPIPETEGIPTYDLYSGSLAGQTITMVGYGQSGDGVNGYTVGPSWSVKRVGQNVVDAFYGQDDRKKPAANEVFRYDFDGPDGNGPLGGGTLGNDSETTLGGGDSGGPSFVIVTIEGVDHYRLAGVNTFTQGSTAPLFGSLGGGIALESYVTWITAVLDGGSSGGGGGGGGKGGGKGKNNAFELAATAIVSGPDSQVAITLAWTGPRSNGAIPVSQSIVSFAVPPQRPAVLPVAQQLRPAPAARLALNRTIEWFDRVVIPSAAPAAVLVPVAPTEPTIVPLHDAPVATVAVETLEAWRKEAADAPTDNIDLAANREKGLTPMVGALAVFLGGAFLQRQAGEESQKPACKA